MEKAQILIDDDDYLSRVGLQQHLEAMGFIVNLVDGREYSGNTHDTRNTIIFVNVESLTGDVLESLTERSIRYPCKAVIAILPPQPTNLRTQCIAAGMADILEQPLSSDSLYECICSLSAPLYTTISEDATERSSNQILRYDSNRKMYKEPYILA